MKAIMYLFFATILFTSCDETKKVIDVAGSVQLSGNYNVVSINDEVVEEKVPTISFFALDKSIRGSTGCNSFFGKYVLDLYALSFNEIGSTEMACDPEVMDVESAFLNALRETGSYVLENDALTLYSKSDRSVLLVASKEQKDKE